MAWTNNYEPPLPPDPTTFWGPEPYDTNFVFPVHPSVLENDRIKLTPFIPRVHAKAYFDAASPHADVLYRYLPWPPRLTLDMFLQTVEYDVRREPGWILFAILDKTRPGAFDGASLVGMVGLLHTNAPQLSSEIGAIIILPDFQRTHVTRNAVGLLLHWCLDVPTAERPALGLRRVEWFAHEANVASAKTAQRMGFKKEGVLRWHKVCRGVLHLLDCVDGDIGIADWSSGGEGDAGWRSEARI